ncbi:MAG TPA: arginine--tRNA ligase [Lentisphaeria bacterium]|nr:arginine--tRNA ligase [Lentisphaeria bacterium]
MHFGIIDDIATHLAAAGKLEVVDIAVDPCPADMTGDITVNCFRLAKALRRKPDDIAEDVTAFCNRHADVKAAERIKAFVNVTLTNVSLFRDTVANAVALLPRNIVADNEKERFLVEYSAPNTNKPQHLGHVRNNTLGMAIGSILKRVGHDVTLVNLINDRGVHICKSMIAYQRFGDDCTPESTGKKGDHLVGDFYVRFDQELKKQIAELKERQPELADAKEEALFPQTELGDATHAMLRAWEDDDPEVRDLWEKLNGWVLDGFNVTYARAGAEFDRVYFESDTYILGRDIVDDGLKRGVFTRREDGAVEIDLEAIKLGRKVVLRSDGTSVYVTQDIGTTVLKYRDFEPTAMIWVVGDEQKYHFDVLFAILKALGYEWADNLHHLAYGMVNLPQGKMKSREGTVVDADDLFDGMTELARQKTLEKWEEVPDDIDRRAHVIAMAAIKLMLLKVGVRSTIKFDPEAAIRFEGDSGPFVLYNYARIASLKRKTANADLPETVDWSLLGEPTERALAIRCAGYVEVLRRAAREFDTSLLSGYLIDLARDFSSFWNACPVLKAKPTLARTRLELCSVVAAILGDGLDTLTIDKLESM